MTTASITKWGPSLISGSAVGDRVLEDADLVDLDFDLVAGLHPQRRIAARADAAGRAGDQHVAGLQRRPCRDVLDDLGDLENHLLGGRVLHALAVQAARELELAARRNFIGRHHPRAEGAGLREVLAGGPLHGVALPVAHRALVVAAVAGDVIPRVLLRDAPAGLADDHRDLRFEVEVLRLTRADDRLLVAQLRFGHAQENRRLLGVVAPRLDDVVLVVEADADNLVRVGDYRQPRDVRLLVVGRPVQVFGGVGEAVASDERLQVGVLVADIALQVDNALRRDDGVASALRSSKCSESHKCPLQLRYQNSRSATWGCSWPISRECGIFTHACSVLPSPTPAISIRRAAGCNSCSSRAIPRTTTRSSSPPAGRVSWLSIR